MNPKVSVICLSYNHERFIVEALDSVFHQSYSNIEIIIVDDASKDASQQVISDWLHDKSDIVFIPLENNVGNCKAFNVGFAHATGEYIIDFATDDVMCLDRIEKQVSFFKSLDQQYGVVFTDAEYVDEEGVFLRNHFEYLFRKKLIKEIPQGDVYSRVIDTYFISSPTMMVRKSVMDELGGYDEKLAYEDFDFWVRSSRHFKFAYLPERLTKVRKSKSSLSTRLYQVGDPQLYSTYEVCLKILELNRSREEVQSLIWRVRYELRQSVLSGNYKEGKLFSTLLRSLTELSFKDYVWGWINETKVSLVFLKRIYDYIYYR